MTSEAVDEAVGVIERRNAELRALLATCRIGGGDGPLSGVPYTLKDVWPVEGLATTYGHAPWRDEIAAESGVVHRAFHDAGAVLVGKSNLCDLGITPESASYVGGVTRHPMDPTRTSGGSSGGAAVAVATGMAAFDWGSDYGGSIRLPAAWCGVVGLRLSASAWPVPDDGPRPSPRIASLTAMGPIARDLETCRRVLDVAEPTLCARRASPPPFSGLLLVPPDARSRGHWPGFERELTSHLRARALPVSHAPLPGPRAFERAFVALLASHADVLLSAGGVAPSAVLSALGPGPRLGDRRLHPESARVALELTLLSARYRDKAGAMRRAEALRRRAEGLFDAGFVLLTPTTGFEAPRLGQALSTRGATAHVKIGSIVDATELTVPFGAFGSGLPRGLSLLGPAGSERRLLELAEAIGAP